MSQKATEVRHFRSARKVLFWIVLVVGALTLLELTGGFLGRFLLSPSVGQGITSLPMALDDDVTVWKYVPNYKQSVTVDGYNNTISINSLGVRDDEWSSQRINRESKILTIGDSFTFGWGVDIFDTYWKQTAELLNRGMEKDWEAFGIGHWMSSFDQHVLFLKRFFDKVKPKIVIWGIYPGHLLTILPRKHVLDADGHLQAVIDPVVTVRNNILHYEFSGKAFKTSVAFPYILSVPYRIWREYIFHRDYAALVDLRSSVSSGDELIEEKLPMLLESYEKLWYSIREAKYYTDKKGCQLVIVIIPEVAQVLNGRTGQQFTKYENEWLTSNFPQQEIISFCSENNIHCLDPLAKFRAYPNKNKLYFPQDPHFSPEGHALFARTISDYLRAIQLVD